jgi:hypothetical protein
MSSLPDRLASEPGLKRLQLAGRGLFALLVTVYFIQAGTLAFSDWLTSGAMVVLLVLFLAAHAALTLRRIGAAEGLAVALDLVAIGLTILLDPGEPPPSMVLVLIVLLSSGVAYGLARFARVLAAAVLMLALIVPARLEEGQSIPAAGSLFLLATLLVCVVYFGLMVYRNQVLARQARDATWHDPETGLISHAAMISTAGWLIPLHDRLGTTLTVLLITPREPGELPALADQIFNRLRRSDIAGRYDDQCLALLLPDTDTGATEQLLASVHQSFPGCRAAMISLNNPDHSLEAVLDHLARALPRSRDDDGHWLVHASAL